MNNLRFCNHKEYSIKMTSCDKSVFFFLFVGMILRAFV